MKAITLWVFLAGAAVLAGSCRHFGRNRIVVDDGENRVDIRYDGDIRFNDEETAIASISPRGYLQYRRNGERLLAGNNNQGVVEYDMEVGGKPVDPASAEGKAILARAIRTMIGLGFDIDGRMDRLYRKGGAAALLKATDSLDGDYVKGRYFQRILEGDSLSAGMVRAVLARVRERIGGNYDKEQLLLKVDTGYLKDDSVSAAYLGVAESIDGNYEKSQVLQYYLRTGVPVRRYPAVLAAVSGIDGNYERSNVLSRLIDQPLPEGPSFDSLLRVIGQMDGDYEKGNLLKQMIHKEIKEDRSWAELIRTALTLNGEYDRGTVLVEIGARLPRTDSLRAAYLSAAKSVRSDDEYGKIVRAMEEDGKDRPEPGK